MVGYLEITFDKLVIVAISTLKLIYFSVSLNESFNFLNSFSKSTGSDKEY